MDWYIGIARKTRIASMCPDRVIARAAWFAFVAEVPPGNAGVEGNRSDSARISTMTTIRHAKSSDVERIYDLIVAIADHHGQTQHVWTNPAELLAAGFGDEPGFGVLLAEHDGLIVGFVSYTINYSIWRGRRYMNIDDVYVDAHCRGLGIGEALMQESKKYCRSLGMERIRWQVQTDNHKAIRFYERLGAKYVEKGIFSWDVSR